MILETNDLNNLFNKKVKDYSGVNFISLINKRSFKDNKKVSFIAKYEKTEEYYTLKGKKDNNKKTDEFYYGLKPSFNFDILVNAFYDDTLINKEALDKFLEKYADYFMLDYNEDKKIINALFAKTVIMMSLHYGYNIKMDESDLDFITEVNNKINQIKKEHLEYTNYIDFDENKKMVYLKGRPDPNLFVLFDYSYDFNTSIVLKKKKDNSLNELYTKNENGPKIGLVGSNEYYSGVLTRLRKIIDDEELYNSKTDSFTLVLSRTTYSTVDSLTNNEILRLPIFNEYKKYINSFNKKEYELENELLNNFDKNYNDNVGIINDYLIKSHGPFNIAISANIISDDGYLLFSLRSNDSIDSCTLYCSANGQAEFADKNVDFYFKSSYEDYPTIYTNSERIDFKGEISRECYAELKLPEFENDYKYFGISILGIDRRNKDNVEYENSRMHFNVLATHNSKISFKEIRDKSKDAVESFENKDIYGFNLILYKNKWTQLGSFILSGLKWLVNHKSLVLNIIAIAFAIVLGFAIPFFNNVITVDDLRTDFWQSMRLKYFSSPDKSIPSWISSILAVVSVVFMLFTYIKYRKNKTKLVKLSNKYNKYNKREEYNDYKTDMINIFDKSYIKLNKKLLKKTKQKKENIFSPISVLMLALYIDDINK